MATTATTPNIIPALVDFITTFATPALADSNHVINGFERNIAPPKDKQDFCVIQPLRHCYSRNLFDAASRAQTFETVARSFAGVDLFSKHAIDCQNADGVQNLTAILDEAQYQSRWALTLHLGYWRTVEISQDYIEAMEIEIHNVDVRFPPA